jgi:thiamine biosynthesis lipoprotein ApbE
MAAASVTRPDRTDGAPRWGIASFPAIGTTARVLVTGAQRLGHAVEVVTAQLEQLDAVASRFRADSEVAALAAGRTTRVSPLLLALVRAALRAARLTGGAVDPTVGGALSGLGYDRDFPAVPAESAGPLVVRRVPGWTAVEVDEAAGTVRVPAGVVLDLGATAKAYAADRAARDAAAAVGCGVLVSLGGDIAVAGACPPGVWMVRLADDSAAADPGLPSVRIRTGGLATSSTAVRRWRRGGVGLHHILDPLTGLPADTPWRTVSVAAASCLDAQIAATATMVRGLDWLAPIGLPARLVAADRQVGTVGGWPA